MKIDFEITQNGLTYRDALHLPDEHALTQAEIEAMQMERFNNWAAFVEAASNAPADQVDG